MQQITRETEVHPSVSMGRPLMEFGPEWDQTLTTVFLTLKKQN